MEISNVNRFETFFEFRVNGQTTVGNNSLKGLVTIDPSASATVLGSISPFRQSLGSFRLKSVMVHYQILTGSVTSITATLELVKYNNGAPDTVTNIPITNSGYATTVGVDITGTSTVNTPVYITPSDGDIYRMTLIYTAGAAVTIIQFTGMNAIFDQREPYPPVGNTLTVDQVNGNNALASPGGNPYATINAALAAATAGTVVIVHAGTYNETITLPTGVTLRGAATPVMANATLGLPAGGGTIIQQTGVVAATDLVTMGENSRLEDVTLNLTSSAHVQLRAVVFPGTTSQTARLRTVNALVDNSTASTTGSSNVYGIHSFGTGLPSEYQTAIRAVSLAVRSAGGGNKRGILVDTNVNNIYARDVNFIVTATGGVGVGVSNSYIGAEVNRVGATLGMRLVSVQATPGTNVSSADISQTAGTLVIGASNLFNSTANGLSFSTIQQPSMIIWADPGSLPSNQTNFYRPGTAAVTSTEIQIRVSQKCLAKALAVKCRAGPGGGRTDTWTIRRNGVNTILTVSLTDIATSNINTTTSATFNAGDLISLQVTTAANTGTTDSIVQVDLY